MAENENNGIILVLEDSLDANEHLEQLLSGEGHQTILAPREEGVTRAEATAPDIVLVDLRMFDNAINTTRSFSGSRSLIIFLMLRCTGFL